MATPSSLTLEAVIISVVMGDTHSPYGVVIGLRIVTQNYYNINEMPFCLGDLARGRDR
jgi:hypothetical protein